MVTPTKLAFLICAAAGLLGMAGCAPIPVRRAAGVTITVNTANAYRPPLGAVPAPASATPGNYDYSGIAKIIDGGQIVAPIDELNRVSLRNALVVGQITPVATPIAARLHIVIPDHDRLRLLAQQRMHTIQGGAVELHTEVERLDLHEIADAVVRSQAFQSADIAEANDTVWPDADGADYVLWFQVQSARPNNAGPWVGTWQMRRANGSAPLVASGDPGTPPGPPRLMSFVRSVQEDAATLTGAPSGVADIPRARNAGRAFSNGSGIVIDPVGHVLTDSHVIANCPDIRVSDAAGGAPLGASLVANDVKLDLALLKIDARNHAYARFRDSQTLRPGEPLVATGFPLTGLVSPEMAVTTGSLTALSGGHGNTRVFQFSAPVQPGNSGGPVLDSSGRVAGLSTFVLNGLAVAIATGGMVPQNVNFATKSDVVRDYLAGINITLTESPGAPAGLDPSSVADIARAFTTKVECWH